LFICGGHTPTVDNAYIKEVLNDIWYLDLDGEDAFKEWKKSETTGISFPKLTESNGILHDGKWYFFGGFTTDYNHRRMNTMYILDIETMYIISCAPPVANSPRGRSVHSAVYYDEGIYIYGGWDTSRCYNDFWKFDLKTKVFTKLSNVLSNGSSTKELPATRYPVAGVYKDKMYLTSGFSSTDNHVNALYEYDFTNSTWQEIQTKGKSPPLRSRSRGFVRGDYLYILGGYNMSTRVTYGDMHKLYLKTFEWTEVRVGGVPVICQHSCIIHETGSEEDGSDILYVFGGFSDRATNNLYALRMFN